MKKKKLYPLMIIVFLLAIIILIAFAGQFDDIDLIIFLRSPIGENLFFFLGIPLFAFTVSLWILSKLMPFKKQDILTALRISLIITFIPFIIRSTSLLLSLPDPQKVPFNTFALITEIVLLFVLIKKVYSSGWPQTIFVWIVTYGARWMVIIILVFYMFTSLPALFQPDNTPYAKVGMTDFYLSEGSISISAELGANSFKVYRSDIVTPVSLYAVNLISTIGFANRTENVSMNMDCAVPEGVLFSSLSEDKTINRYTFKSAAIRNLNFSAEGHAWLACDFTCPTKALLNTNSNIGTELIYIERRKAATAHVAIVFRGNDSATMTCNVYIMSENPIYFMNKSFTVQYIAD